MSRPPLIPERRGCLWPQLLKKSMKKRRLLRLLKMIMTKKRNRFLHREQGVRSPALRRMIPRRLRTPLPPLIISLRKYFAPILYKIPARAPDRRQTALLQPRLHRASLHVLPFSNCPQRRGLRADWNRSSSCISGRCALDYSLCWSSLPVKIRMPLHSSNTSFPQPAKRWKTKKHFLISKNFFDKYLAKRSRKRS